MGWVIALVIFGLIFRGIDNWAHAGGLLSGIGFSFLMGYNDNKQETAWNKMLAYACILLTAAVLLWSVVNSLFIGLNISI